MRLPIKRIIELVSQVSAVSVEDIIGPRRQRLYIRPRFIVYHIASAQGHSANRIAEAMNRDHTTIIHALGKVGIYRRDDPLFERLFVRVQEAVDSGEYHPKLVRVPARLIPPEPQKPKEPHIPGDPETKKLILDRRAMCEGSRNLLQAIERERRAA